MVEMKYNFISRLQIVPTFKTVLLFSKSYQPLVCKKKAVGQWDHEQVISECKP